MKTKKRQYLPSGLWVVSTPIGNLADFSPRGVQALEEAEWILCEDTRRTSQLLAALEIQRDKLGLERFDAHADLRSLQHWVEKLQEGSSLALVTDAGTPSISDPGAALVAAARIAGIPVIPIPGPSAVMALLSVSGLGGTSFTFRGFFPRKNSEQKEELEAVSQSGLSKIMVWFESPQRIEKTLGMISNFSPDAQMIVGKELTKLHERFFYGKAAQVSREVSREIEKEGTLGEWCFAVEFPSQDQPSQSLDWERAVRVGLGLGASVSEVAAKVSQEFGASKREVYEITLKLAGKKKAEK